MSPVETEYYDLLGVAVDANDNELKKGYRKQAMIYHPDKNKSEDAEDRFKEISKAYQVLSDPNMRAVYDKNGKSMTDKESDDLENAANFFADVFGGERFVDYIGEISLMKDMTDVASAMMTEEETEKKDSEGTPKPEDPSSRPTSYSPLQATIPTETSGELPHQIHATQSAHISPSSPLDTKQSSTSLTPHENSIRNGNSPSPSPSSAKVLERERREKEAKKRLEQKEKQREREKERKQIMEKRVTNLATKMVDRLRPFVEARNAGHKDGPELVAFQKKMQLEVEDLKLESFGIELLHTIGQVYIMKATSFLKSRKLFGVPGFFYRLKEKGFLAKDMWGVIGSALSVREVMLEMEKAQAKGEQGLEELKALEMDMTGKLLLASWRGARLEVIQVLREVVDTVLKESGVSDQILVERAEGLILIGAIFKAAVPDESDDERRQLERIVAEAAASKKGKKNKHPEMTRSAKEASATDAPVA